MGFGVWGLEFGVWGLGLHTDMLDSLWSATRTSVLDLGFGVWGLGFLGFWGASPRCGIRTISVEIILTDPEGRGAEVGGER